MRLRKKPLLVIGIGIFVIALIALGTVRSQQVGQQAELNEELAQAQSNLMGVQLERFSSRQANLEKQLSQTTSQFEAFKAILSQSVGSIAASSILFDIAEAHGLEVTEMTSSTPATERLEEVACSLISLTARVEGDVPNLVSFVTKLNNHFTTGVAKSIIITIPEANSDEKASVDIQLAVYTHQGD